MSISEGDIARALELFDGLGGLSHRKMMGGLTIYRDGTIFSIVSRDGRIFLKARGDVADALADAGSEQFHNRGGKMAYWTLPDAALDDPDLACDWAFRSLAALD